MMVHLLTILKAISEVFSGVFQESISGPILINYLLVSIFNLLKMQMQMQTILLVLTP